HRGSGHRGGLLRGSGRRPLLLRHPRLQPVRGLGPPGRARSVEVQPRARQFRRIQRPGDRAQPAAVALGAPSGRIGVDVLAQVPRERVGRIVNGKRKDRKQEFVGSRAFVNVDRMGNPAINTVLIPFARKDEYNFASTQADADGRFADDIVATLTKLGTNATNIGILASVAVTNGAFLRVDPTVTNSGPGGGNNAGAGFPNGRRLADDTIDTILFFVANQNPLGDNVNANDVPLTNTFPFFAPPHQPRDAGIDDSTRN